MSSQLPIRARIYDVNGTVKHSLIQHQFVLNMLDAFTYHHFPALFCLTALVAHFPTFLFGVLCDANDSMRSNKLSPFQADFIKLPPRTGGQDR
jgi:hypothetical protein